MISVITGILGGITGIAKDWLVDKRKRKAAKLQVDLAIAKAQTEAKIARLKTAQEGDLAWENLSITNSGWRGEWFTVILSIPVILCFVPGMAGYIKEGFEAIESSTPDWYQWAFLTAVASAFGYRKLADFMSLKKGA